MNIVHSWDKSSLSQNKLNLNDSVGALTQGNREQETPCVTESQHMTIKLDHAYITIKIRRLVTRTFQSLRA